MAWSITARTTRQGANLALVVMVAAALASCDAATNRDLANTPTPFPLRTPFAATPAAPPLSAGPIATGSALLAAGHPVDAATVFAAAGSPQPAGTALLDRARSRFAVGDLDGAEADYTAALTRDPGLGAAYAGRASVLLERARGDPAAYQAALDDANRAVAADPTSAEAALLAARVFAARYEFRGDPADLDRGLEELDRLTALAADARLLLLRARILAWSGDPAAADAALAAADDARGTSPTDTALTRAAVAAERGQWDLAVLAASSAVADPFRADEAARLLAEAQLGRNDPTAALAALDPLLDRRPDDGRAHYLRGRALGAMGQTEEARRSLAEAETILAASPVFRAKIAQARQAIG